MTLLIFYIVITLFYLVTIGSLVYGFDKVEDFNLKDMAPKTKFTIIVVFRNEASNLPRLLESFKKLDYPSSLFEIIMVDDFSTDNSREMISSIKSSTDLKIRVLDNKESANSPKKTGIELAISNSNFSWIITTDADCTVPTYWLASYDEFIQQDELDFIIGPVKYVQENSILTRFQVLDNLSLQGATIGAFGINKPFLCNGANICYRRDFYENVGGFKGNENIASGDDIFLMQKANKTEQYKIGYLKSDQAIVETLPEKTISRLFNQRARWTGKTRNYQSLFPKFIGITILLMNLALMLGVILGVSSSFPLRIFLYVLVIKTSIDFLLIFKTARFFKMETSLLFFPLATLLYPVFTALVILKSILGGYNWKGRQFSTHK